MAQQKAKDWCLAGVGLTRASDDADDPALDRVLDASLPMSLFIHKTIWDMRRRVPFHDILFRPTDGPLRAPFIEENLISRWLTVDIPCDLAQLRSTPANDVARTAACRDLFLRGLDHLPTDLSDLRAPIIAGLDAAAAAGHVAPLHRPDRTCVIGAEVLMEVTYLRTPSQKRCHLKLWRPGKPRQAFTKEFEIVPELEDPASNAVRMYEYTPIQGAVLQGDMIRMAQTSWDDTPENGMTINPLMIGFDIRLDALERVIGPVKRLPIA